MHKSLPVSTNISSASCSRSCLPSRVYSGAHPSPLASGPGIYTTSVPTSIFNTSTMARSKKSKSSQAHHGDSSEKKSPSRPTHFLCFPLARESTVPTFARSMAYFQHVSLEPERQPLDRSQQQGTPEHSEETLPQTKEIVEARHQARRRVNSVTEDDPLGDTSQPTMEDDFGNDLKVLPKIVYRGPGTLHLTLGVMNLSDPAEMQKATNLLQSIDLQQMMRDAEKGPPPDMKNARKWEDKDTNESGEAGLAEAGVVEDGSSVNVEQQHHTTAERQDSVGLKTLERPISPPSKSKQNELSEFRGTPQPIYISLTGLSAFSSPKKARVIWAKPHAQAGIASASLNADTRSTKSRPIFAPAQQDRLYNFALHLHQTFKSAGMVNETRQPVLHATIANMRYKVQAKGGRTTKGKNWKYGRKRWDDGLVDVRLLCQVWNEYDGDVDEAEFGIMNSGEHVIEEVDGGHQDDESNEAASKNDQNDAQPGEPWTQDDRDKAVEDPDKEFIWCQDIEIDRVAICKMGATKCQDSMWVEWYPPVVEKMIFQ